MEHTEKLFAVVFSAKTPAQMQGALAYVNLWAKHNRMLARNHNMDTRLDRWEKIRATVRDCRLHLFNLL